MQSKYLEAREIAALRREAGEEWLPLEVALRTGLRIGDVLKIRPEDLTPQGVIYTAEKTGKKGFAALPPDIIEALRKNTRGAWCFPSPRAAGKHLTRQAAWQRIKRAAQRAGVEARGVSPHALRKSFAVERMHTSGLRAVQAALQHDRAGVTEIYALSDWLTGENASKPLLRRDLQAIATKIAELLRGG